LLAAFKVVLHRYTGEEDIVVGTPIANRNRREIEGLIGFFVNTLVLRTELRGNPRFREVLERVREVTLGAYEHQDLPFEKLVEELQPQRTLSHTPLFQVVFTLQNVPTWVQSSSGTRQAAADAPQVAPQTGTAKFDLNLTVGETEEGLMGAVEYNTDLFEAETIDRMVGHYHRLLEAVVANSDQRLSDLPMLAESETAGYTPRDFPDADLSQRGFEDLILEISQI
jgi:non-ribosomal peptide synthetase component F